MESLGGFCIYNDSHVTTKLLALENDDVPFLEFQFYLGTNLGQVKLGGSITKLIYVLLFLL